jgi:glutathione synthase/RimK-type ligase-like ATP-grasp enzyme
MRVKLISDFIDYYDHFFDVTDYDVVFSRKMTDGPNRLEALTIMKSVGLEVPAYGVIRDIYTQTLQAFKNEQEMLDSKYADNMKLVVYTDLRAHCGEAKERLSLYEAYKKYPDCLATQYIPCVGDNGRSFRLLMVGNQRFWLEYNSKDDWRSNCGKVEIQLTSVENAPDLSALHLPLYAIDFVLAPNRILAVDLNVSPGLKSTPVEDILKPQDCADLIKERVAALVAYSQ